MLGYLFWLLAVPTGALAGVLLLMTLAGKSLSAATPAWLSLIAALAVLALVAWAGRLALVSERPGTACALVVLSWVLFAAAMIANGLAHQNTWQ